MEAIQPWYYAMIGMNIIASIPGTLPQKNY